MNIVAFIDAHVHVESRSYDDFVRLSVAGCVGVLAVAGGQAGYRSPDSLVDFFHRLDTFDRERVERAGVKFYLALGIHPGGIPTQGLAEALAALPDELLRRKALAIGEIGLRDGNAHEEHALIEQLRIATRLSLPAVVHTPRTNKLTMLERTLALVAASGVPPARLLLDHLDAETLPRAAQSGCLLGLTIHPTKLSPHAAAKLVADHGPERIVLSTDLGAKPSHLFGLPAAIGVMQELGLPDESIRRVVYDNAAKLLDLSP